MSNGGLPAGDAHRQLRCQRVVAPSGQTQVVTAKLYRQPAQPAEPEHQILGVLPSFASHLPPTEPLRIAAETKGQPWQEPVAGSRGANRPRNCQCAPPEGLSLETS